MFSVKKISLIVGLVAVIAAAVFIGRQSGGESTDNTLLITPRAVERRDLSDVLTVSGEVRRDETKKINSAVDGKVSQINVEDGDTVEIGDGVFALDGRTAVAVPGEFSFYRELTVGSVGPDVKQLETILNDSGYKIRDIDTLFTEDTRTALANWQFDRGYSGSSNENDETITASLSPNGAAYSVGRENTAAFVVTQAVPTSGGSSIRPMVAKPTLNISADKSTVAEGSAVTFTITSDVAPTSDLTIAINTGGSATPGDDPVNDDDYDTILGSAIIKAGELSTSFTSKVFVDNTIEDEEDITVAMTTQFGNDPTYALGNTNQIRVVIPANGSELRPLLTVKASSETISEGSTVTFTVRT